MKSVWLDPAETLGEHIARLTALEAEADSVQVWQPMLIPGLLQSYAYACAAIHATAPAIPLATVSRRAEERRRRIDRLGRPGARTVAVVVDESALYRPVGGDTALVDQLERILALEALQPSLSVRVLPQGGDAHPGLTGAFTLYRAAQQRAVFVETLRDSTISTRPEDVAAYSAAWEQLHGLALPVRESVQLIDGVRTTLWRRLTTN